MSRYDALTHHLEGQALSEVPMTFTEIEQLLGGPLPSSARRHRPWWSNNAAGNTAVHAWRKAGRKTAKVDMASEKVVFVREEQGETRPNATSPPASPLDSLVERGLTPAAEALIDRMMTREGMDRTGAIVSILNAEAIARRRRAIARIRADLPKLDVSMEEIVGWIREDRDGR